MTAYLRLRNTLTLLTYLLTYLVSYLLVQVRKGVCEYLAWLLRMKRPGYDVENGTGRSPRKQRRRVREVELRERSSKSLLANVLDLEDDYRMFQGGGVGGPLNHYGVGGDGRRVDGRAGTCRRHRPSVRLCSHAAPAAAAFVDGGETSAGVADGVPGGSGGGGGTPAVCLLKSILGELRSITTKLRHDERFEDECSDWKFAAMVVDRLCLCLFTMFTVISTFAILFSAPHVLVA